MNFTWSFVGGSQGVGAISWGLKRDSINRFTNNGKLVSLNLAGSPVALTIPEGYTGRVS